MAVKPKAIKVLENDVIEYLKDFGKILDDYDHFLDEEGVYDYYVDGPLEEMPNQFIWSVTKKPLSSMDMTKILLFVYGRIRVIRKNKKINFYLVFQRDGVLVDHFTLDKYGDVVKPNFSIIKENEVISGNVDVMKYYSQFENEIKIAPTFSLMDFLGGNKKMGKSSDEVAIRKFLIKIGFFKDGRSNERKDYTRDYLTRILKKEYVSLGKSRRLPMKKLQKKLEEKLSFLSLDEKKTKKYEWHDQTIRRRIKPTRKK